MTRLLFVMTFVAIWMLPQLSEAQLFRRGIRARGFQQAQPQPRPRIFQTPRNFQTPNLQGQLRQLGNGQLNREAINSGIDALRSVLESALDNRNGAQRPSVIPPQQTGNLDRGNQRPTGNSGATIQSRPSAQTETPAPARKTYSILVTPDKPAKNENQEGKENEAEEMIDSSQTRLDITTPPLEPVEVVPTNSILQIVETPKKVGK